ncbi:MAG: hypothetical protein HQ483_17205 [Rhodospirillales bacterium]|nr:hypothetical protein [Rhodospirillales bacterium]
MIQENIQRLEEAAGDFQTAAVKVKDGINNVLEPEIKDARFSADNTRQIVEVLARRMTWMFAASVLINLAILAYVVQVIPT